MILAAGRGERMRPLTDSTPKPLLKVANKPLIEWHLEKLSQNGFKKVLINMAHLGEMIPASLGDGSRWGLEITYLDERKSGALESAGAIVNALKHLSEEFLVLNGDIWCDYTFDSRYKLKDSLAHLILVPNPDHNKEGDFEYKGNKLTFSGIGYYSKKMFEQLSMQKLALAPVLRENIAKNQIDFEVHKGIWMDIGTPQRLNEANQLFKKLHSMEKNYEI